MLPSLTPLPSLPFQDIKGGYSTATPDWPYFQILDQIVPLMRKEKIEKLSPSGLDSRELEGHEGLPSPLLSPPVEAETLSMPGVQVVAVDDKCKTEAADAGEPPRKRGRYGNKVNKAITIHVSVIYSLSCKDLRRGEGTALMIK